MFAPVITLASLQRFAAAATQCDVFLAELLVVLRLRDSGDVSLICPLLVGPETDAGWTSLLEAPGYEATLAALPDARRRIPYKPRAVSPLKAR